MMNLQRCVRAGALLWVVLFAAGLAAAEEAKPSAAAAEALRLLESEDLYQRQTGFLRLEALREPATLPAIRGYLSHRDPEVRAYSLRAIAAIGGVASIPTLLEALRSDKHERVRRSAILGLEPFAVSDPAVLPAFLSALKDRSPQVRMSAVDVVSRINDPRAREAIRQRRRRERNGDVRRVLKAAVARSGA